MSKRCPRTRRAHEDGECGFDNECPLVFEALMCSEIGEYKRVACEVRAQLQRARKLGTTAPFYNVAQPVNKADAQPVEDELQLEGEVEEVDPSERYAIRRLARDAFW